MNQSGMRSKVVIMAITVVTSMGVALLGLHFLGWDGVLSPGNLLTVQNKAVQNKTEAIRTPAAKPGRARPERKDFGDWMLICSTDGTAPCTVGQQLTRKADDKLVVALSLSPLAGGGSTLIVHTPPGVLLTGGPVVTTDNGVESRVPFTQCLPTQCQASASVDGKFVESLAAAKKITVSFKLGSGQAVNVGLGVDGLSKALAALNAKRAR